MTTKFLKLLKNNKLVAHKCKKCGNLMIPLRPVCNICGSNELEEKELSGYGTVESYTVIYTAAQKFADKVPFVIAIVKLDEGVRLMGRIENVDVTEPNKIMSIKRVKIKYPSETEEQTIIFVP